MNGEQKDNTWIWIVITVIIVIVIGGGAIAFFSLGNKNNSLTENPSDITTTEGAEKSTEPTDVEETEETSPPTPINNTSKRYKIGETISYNGKKLTVEKVNKDWKSSKSWAKPAKGTQFVVINVTLKNDTDKVWWFNELSEYDLMDAKGEVYENTSLNAEGIDNLQQGKLYPGKKFNSNIVYEVDSDAVEKLTLLFYPNYENVQEEEQIEIDLQ